MKTMVEETKIVTALAPITPSTSTPDYVKMTDGRRLLITIMVDNATTVTGSAITLKQATAAAGTGEKALAFSFVWANTDTGAADALTKTAVTSNTFTTATTDNKNLMYVIEVDASDLDMENGFEWVRLGTADAANMILSASYQLYNLRYKQATPATAIA